MTSLSLPLIFDDAIPRAKTTRYWMPQRVLVTPDALQYAHGKSIIQRAENLKISIEELPANRLTGLRGATERETYKRAKSTLAVVCAPPSQFKLQPIPPSSDWQFHLAQGCPAHCQYCYLAGSLSGPPVVRAYANLDEILGNLKNFEQPEKISTFEASCYTDVLAIEHLTGSLAKTIEHFATRPCAELRFVSKFDAVDSLLNLSHNKRARARLSLNAPGVARRLESGTSSVPARIEALQKLARAGYPIGVVLAPIMAIESWQSEYAQLLESVQESLNFPCDLTWELISHRFTPKSKDVLLNWYPATTLEMNEASRTEKRNKFGGVKFVYPREIMREMKDWFHQEIATRFPDSKILYWT